MNDIFYYISLSQMVSKEEFMLQMSYVIIWWIGFVVRHAMLPSDIFGT